MATGSGAGSGLFKSLRPRFRPQGTDIAAAVSWGVGATVAALWIIQNNEALANLIAEERINKCLTKSLWEGEVLRSKPFDWLKKKFLEKPEPEK